MEKESRRRRGRRARAYTRTEARIITVTREEREGADQEAHPEGENITETMEVIIN